MNFDSTSMPMIMDICQWRSSQRRWEKIIISKFNHDINSITHDESWMHLSTFLFFMFRLLLFQGASSSQHSSPISWIEWCIRLPSINFIFSLCFRSLRLRRRRLSTLCNSCIFFLSIHVSHFLYYIYFYVVSDVYRVTSKIFFWVEKVMKMKEE